MVRLLHSVKIPTGFKKMVRDKVSQGVSVNNGLWFLNSHLQPTGLTLANSMVECRENEPYITLVIQNHGTEAVRLKKGQVLGSVAEVEAVDPDKCDQIQAADGVVAAMAESPVPPHRSEQIMMALDVQHQHLSAERH